MEKRSLVFAFAVLFCFCGVRARAASKFGAGRRSPCHEDIAKFCAKIKPGRWNLVRCLKGHKGELSSGCSAHMAELHRKYELAKKARPVPDQTPSKP